MVAAALTAAALGDAAFGVGIPSRTARSGAAVGLGAAAVSVAAAWLGLAAAVELALVTVSGVPGAAASGDSGRGAAAAAAERRSGASFTPSTSSNDFQRSGLPASVMRRRSEDPRGEGQNNGIPRVVI